MDDKYRRRIYSISPYNTACPGRFEQLRLVVGEIFREMVIEHVGSTSIPGMSGKDCVDVMVIVEDIALVDDVRVSAMEAAGFSYAGQVHSAETRMFRLMDEGRVLSNVHVFERNSPHAIKMIRLRDYMRMRPDELQAYSKLKVELYEKFATDYKSYRTYKDEYVQELMKRVNESYDHRTV